MSSALLIPEQYVQKWFLQWGAYILLSEVIISRWQWYDDKPWGGCSIPASWKLLYKKGEEWVPVKPVGDYEIAKDKYNTVRFEPITTTAMRMVVQLSKTDASGIHEWIVK